MTSDIEITQALLIKLAGEGAFSRGKTYFQQGNVLNWKKTGTKISATVDGSKPYQVSLVHNSRRLDGACDCPASDGFDFCKHCVAVALAYQQDESQQTTMAKGGVEQRIQAYLLKLDKAELVDELLQQIVMDASLKQQWSIKADVALGKVDAKALKKRITGAFPYGRELYRYPQVRAYFAKAEPVIDLLQQQLDSLDFGVALKLVDYALQRLAKALQAIDDSGGFRLDLEAILHTLHIRLVGQQGWSSEQLADYLYAIKFGDAIDLYPAIPESYAEILQDSGLQHFYVQVQGRWDLLPQLPIGAGWEEKSLYSTLQFILEPRAKVLKDFPALLALKQKTATEAYDFSNLCELCIEYDEWSQAEFWLSKAKKHTKDNARYTHRNYTNEHLQIKIWLHSSEYEKATELQWEIYQGSLVLDNYNALIEIANQSNNPKRDGGYYAAQARSYLTGLLDSRKNTNGFGSPYTDALIKILLQDDELDAALAISQQYKVDTTLLLKIARKFNKKPVMAMPLYERLVRTHVQGGNNNLYHQAIDLLKELQGMLKVPAHQKSFNILLMDFRGEFKPKRNFIKWLNETFPLE